MEVREIQMDDPLYQEERELRNEILLRPIGIPDFGWEHRDKDSIHVVAIEEGKVIGCLIYAVDSPESGQLMQMAVTANKQKSGIGRALVQHLVEITKAKGYKEITCHARDYAVPFYEKCGFTIHGKPFLEADVWHSHMRYSL